MSHSMPSQAQVCTSKPLAELLQDGLPSWAEAELSEPIWYIRRLKELEVPDAFVEFDKGWSY